MTSYRQPGTVLTDHTFTVPLDHAKPDGEQIQVFAREVVAADKASADLPWLVFFQGGPGFGSPRPAGREAWLDRALDDYRVLLLDQRGTDSSSPVNRRTLSQAGLGSAQAQADYIALFRADSIVADAELIRQEVTGGQPWSILGQSFGGFCAVCYLSQAPEGLREAFITGGLPGLDVTADDVYRATYPKVARRNAEHYERYPMDVQRAKDIARRLAAGDVRLPNGAPLTVETFQTFGQMLGASTGSHSLHYLLEEPFAGGDLSDDFLHRVGSQVSFSAAPLYALVHEACYGQGAPTNWAAQRVRAEFPEFDAALDSDAAAAVHRRDDLPVDVRERPGAQAAGRGRGDPGPARVAAAVRPRAAAGQPGARRGRRVFRGHVRAGGVLGADGPHDPGAAALGHQRVRARRPAGQQRQGAGPPDRHGPRQRLIRRGGGEPPEAVPGQGQGQGEVDRGLGPLEGASSGWRAGR